MLFSDTLAELVETAMTDILFWSQEIPKRSRGAHAERHLDEQPLGGSAGQQQSGGELLPQCPLQAGRAVPLGEKSHMGAAVQRIFPGAVACPCATGSEQERESAWEHENCPCPGEAATGSEIVPIAGYDDGIRSQRSRHYQTR